MKSELAVKLIAPGCTYRFTCCRCYDDRRGPFPIPATCRAQHPSRPGSDSLIPPCLAPNPPCQFLVSLPHCPYLNPSRHVGNRKLRSTLTSSYITFRPTCQTPHRVANCATFRCIQENFKIKHKVPNSVLLHQTEIRILTIIFISDLFKTRLFHGLIVNFEFGKAVLPGDSKQTCWRSFFWTLLLLLTLRSRKAPLLRIIE